MLTRCCFILLITTGLFGQPKWRELQGTGAPSGSLCDADNAGGKYFRNGDPASVSPGYYVCRQTGASTYAWHPASHMIGTTAPATCDIGEVFFDSDATAGQNWFGCTASNTWTLLRGPQTRTITFILGAENGSVLGDGDDQPSIFINRLGGGITITEVHCECDGGTPSINLQRDDGTPANILSSNLSCSTSGATGTIDGAEDNVANTEKIDFVMVTAGGTAKRATVTIKFTVDP